MGDNIQRELKFRVHDLKLDLLGFTNRILIEQFFINDEELCEEKRYRKENSAKGLRYYYTLKVKGDFERAKLPDREITKEMYQRALIHRDGDIVLKTRYFIYYDGIEITKKPNKNSVEIKLDIYHDKLEGLITAEVLVDDIESAKNIYLPLELGTIENLTYDSRFKNGSLASAKDLKYVFVRKQYNVTFSNLIKGIKNTDRNSGNKFNQDLKYFEETGELAQTILKDLKWTIEAKIKGTIAEELFDVIYYLLTKLIENEIDFDMSSLAQDEAQKNSYDSFKTIIKHVSKLDCKYDKNDNYQQILLTYFQLLSGKIAAEDLNKLTKIGEIDKEKYRKIINDMILIIFEIARINGVNMEKAAIVKESKNSVKYNRESHFLVPKEEIEKKYTVDRIDFDLEGYSSAKITQCYLSVKPEKRVRRMNDKFYYTEKNQGGLVRDESIDILISEDKFEKLLEQGYEGIPIEKTRYYLYFDPEEKTYFPIKRENDVLLELDIYKNALEGHITVETEFPSIADVIVFSSLPGMHNLVDVTEDKNYKNASLALNGWPTKFKSKKLEKSCDS